MTINIALSKVRWTRRYLLFLLKNHLPTFVEDPILMFSLGF